ncbi:sporadically distributed protein, TIGR04141 family [Pseudomonas sp. KBS0710]|uniref:DUF6119 family protein n=1 Tax=Pseudomonas sp. KBS0710 TaxID=1179667 RepID=UPI00110DDE26|nr:DUF6119 family protein [Pseudomonas sp. KBS0710]TSD76152.1 sporadically distributed protein, TIGR04141 family [Pseudomonas sp. KBS0710]
MPNTYNIYKIKHHKIKQLKEKLKSVGLIEQKTLPIANYSKTFYFSENIEGNNVWWWETYREFFNDKVKEPKNKFNFGVLLCQCLENQEQIYAVSLGKSHFYLSKFIYLDFGIDLAIRVADENSILLKKSRYFTGTKRQDVSSYKQFQIDNYEAGESVDHLKLKAANKEIWGERNIIFADSIQMDMDKQPLELSAIFQQIDESFRGEKIINLPKLESVSAEAGTELDKLLLQHLKSANGQVFIEEFQVHGIAICFSFHDYDYEIKAKGEQGNHRKLLGNTIDIQSISEFLSDHLDITDINNITVQFKSEDTGRFTRNLKEILDCPIEYEEQQYFLKNGEWFVFNQTFMNYLKRSLGSIEIKLEEPLIESEFITWQTEKRKNAKPDDDKIDYREAYFNQKICSERGYQLLDRVLTDIKSLEQKRRSYQVEVADIYNNGEIISVKISKKKPELIYNIEQSRDAITLIKNKTIKFDRKFHGAALWFVFEENVEKITDVNSIQFLLAVESWHKLVINHGLIPKIYISKHERDVKKKKKKET